VVITEVRIKLMEDNNENERLQAFCSVTFDDAFVVRDLKIIEGTKGSFVAMPSRKLTDRCPSCGSKNHLRARFCNQCGAKLDEDRATRDADGRVKLHADIAHPINSACREVIQSAVIKAFLAEKERSKQPGYVCTYDDFDSDYDSSFTHVVGELNAPRGYRTHGGHGGRGGHGGHHATPAHETAPAAKLDDKRSEGFGAGIL
jgi:stage V sporulation protein G